MGVGETLHEQVTFNKVAIRNRDWVSFPIRGSRLFQRSSALPLRPRALFFRCALGRREDLEAFVGDRLPALDREAVCSGGETLLGSLDGGELFAQVISQTLVELVLVEIGCEICRVELVGRLAVVLMRAPTERALDPLALGRQ